MTEKERLSAAYALKGVEDVKSLYRDWASTYDEGFVAEKGYVLHENVAKGFAEAGGGGPVLDVGAGTGLVGEVLAWLGVGPVEGTDISEEMLAIAAKKGCYERVFIADITQALPIPEGHFGGVVSAGAFTLGHLGPEPLGELIRITRPGGLLAIAVNEAHWDAAQFAPAFEGLGHKITQLSRTPIRIYADSATHDHADDMCLLVSFRRK